MPAVEIYPTTLEKIAVYSDSVRSFFMKLDGGRTTGFTAGQFYMAHVPRDANFVKKPYSIASPPSMKDCLELCIKRVESGYVSNYFFRMKEGDKLPLQGPYGKFIIKEPAAEQLIFVATGTGIAPLRSMFRDLLEKGSRTPMLCILGVRYENEILYHDEFRALEQRHPTFKFIPTISRPQTWTGEKGYVQEKLKAFVTPGPTKHIYICGLEPMIRAVEETAKQMGFAKEQIHYEIYV